MVKRVIAKMGTSKNNYYRDNLQQSLKETEKIPEKHLLLQSRGQLGSPKQTYVAQSPLGAQTKVSEIGNPSEKQTLLKPVKLSPGWEEKDIPADELNFHNMPYEDDSQDDNKEPKDTFRVVYFIFLLHGIGTLMPWNMFIISEKSFIKYKEHPIPSTDDGNSGVNYLYQIIHFHYFTDYKLNVTGMDPELINNFPNYVAISAQVPNVILSAVNIFIQFGGDLTKRTIWSIIIIIVIFIITIILAIVNSSDWPLSFFYITLISIVIINMANAIYQNSIYGLAAMLPGEYTNSVIIGSSLSGIFATVIGIITLATSPNLRTATIYYFIIALFVLLVCFDTYFALPLMKFFRFHEQKNKPSASRAVVRTTRPPYFHIFKQAWVQFFGVFLTFFVTLTIFPNMMNRVKSLNLATDLNITSPAWDIWFLMITCFLNFNVFSFLGNLVPSFFAKPGPRWVWIPIVVRTLLIPAFLFCNYDPKNRTIPVLITNDWVYIFLVAVMSLTNGYFASLCMMYAPGTVEPQHAPTAGMMAAFFLILGIFCGVNFSLAVSHFVQWKIFQN